MFDACSRHQPHPASAPSESAMIRDRLVATVQAELPNFPTPVISACIPFASNDSSWPPLPGSETATAVARLEAAFNAPLRQWFRIRWRKQALQPSAFVFPEGTVNGLLDLVRTHAGNEETFLGRFIGEDSRQRFWREVRCLLATGDFSEPPVVVGEQSSTRLVDGSHRLAAYAFVHECAGIREVYESGQRPSVPLLERPHFWIAAPL
jgi:hypothetical protein